MVFGSLHANLMALIRERVRSGTVTERALANLAGISQPHIHNVLKGVRRLSMEAADILADRLDISLADLVRSEYAEVPLLEGRLGPDNPFPAVESASARYPFLRAEISHLDRPVAARLAADPGAAGFFREGDLVLLNRAEAGRQMPNPGEHYALAHCGGGLVRRVRRGSRGLYLLAEAEGASGDYISLRDRHILEIVKAKVVWIGRYLEPVSASRRPHEKIG